MFLFHQEETSCGEWYEAPAGHHMPSKVSPLPQPFGPGNLSPGANCFNEFGPKQENVIS